MVSSGNSEVEEKRELPSVFAIEDFQERNASLECINTLEPSVESRVLYYVSLLFKDMVNNGSFSWSCGPKQ